MPKKKLTPEEERKKQEKAAEEERKRQEKAALKAEDKRKKDEKARKKAEAELLRKKQKQQGRGGRTYSVTSVGSGKSGASPVVDSTPPWGPPQSTTVEETNLDTSPPLTGATGTHRAVSPPHRLELLPSKDLRKLKNPQQTSAHAYEPIPGNNSEASSEPQETPVKSKVPQEEDLTSGPRPTSPSRGATRSQSDARETTRQLQQVQVLKKQLEAKDAEIATLIEHHGNELQDVNNTHQSVYQRLEREHKEKLSEKEKIIESRTKDLTEANGGVITINNQLEDKKRELKKSSETNRQLNAQVVDLTGQLNLAKSAAEKLEEDLAAKAEENQTLKDNQETAIADLNSQLEQVRSSHSSTEEQLLAANNRVDELEDKLQKAGEQKEALINSNVAAQEARVNAVQRVKELETKLAEQVRQLEQEHGSQMNELKLTHEASLRELEVQNIEQVQEIEKDFTSEMNELKATIEKLETEHSEALHSQEQGYLAKLEEARNGREQYAAVMATPPTVSEQQLRLEIEAELNKSYKNQIEELEAKNDQIKAGVDSQLEGLQSQYEANNKEKEDVISQLSREKWALEQTIKQLEQDTELSRLQELKTVNDERQMNDLQQQVEMLGSENQRLQNELLKVQPDPKSQSLPYTTPTGPSPLEPNSEEDDFQDAKDKMPSLGAPENFTDNEKLQQLTNQIDTLLEEKAQLVTQLQDAAALATKYEQSMVELQADLGREQKAKAELDKAKQELLKSSDVADKISKHQDSDSKFKHMRNKFLELTTQKVEQEAKLQKKIKVLNEKIKERDEQLKNQRSPFPPAAEPGESQPAHLRQLESTNKQQGKVIMELRDQLKALETTNGDLEDEVLALRGEVAGAKQNEEEREKVSDDILHAECHDYIAKLEAQIEEWKSHCEKLQSEAKSIHASRLPRSDGTLMDPLCQDEPVMQVKDDKVYAEYLSEQLTVVQEENEQLKVNNVRLKADNTALEALRVERDRLQQDLLRRINTNRDLQRRVDVISGQVSDLKKQAAAWPPVKQGLERDLEEMRSENELLRVQVCAFEEDFKKERQARSQIAGRMDSDKETYLTTINRQQEEIEALQDQVDTIRTQVDALEKRKGESAYRITDMERQCKEQLNKISELEKLCREKSSEISELKKSNEEFEDLLESTLKKLNQEQQLRQTYDSERKTKTELITTIQQKAKDSEANFERVRAQLEAEARRLKHDAQRVQEEMDQNTSVVTAEKMSLEEQLADLGARFKLKEKHLEIAESEKQNLQEQLSRTQDQLTAVQAELADEKERLEVCRGETQDLFDQVREKVAQVKQYSKQGESLKQQLEEKAELLEEKAELLYKTQQEAEYYNKQGENFRRQWEDSASKLHKTQQEIQRLNQLVKTMDDDAQFKIAEVRANNESDRLAAQSDLASARRKVQQLEAQLQAMASGGGSGAALQAEIDKRKGLEQQLGIAKSKSEELFAKCVSRNAAIDKLKKTLAQNRIPIPALDLDPHLTQARRPPGHQLPQQTGSRKQASSDYEHLEYPPGGPSSLRGGQTFPAQPQGGARDAHDGNTTDVNYENDSNFVHPPPANNAPPMRAKSTDPDYDNVPQGLAGNPPASTDHVYGNSDQFYRGNDPSMYMNTGGAKPPSRRPQGFSNNSNISNTGKPPSRAEYANIPSPQKPPSNPQPPVKRSSHDRLMSTGRGVTSTPSAQGPTSQAGPVPMPRRGSGSSPNTRRPKVNSDVQENLLLQNIDSEIKAAAEYVIQEGEEPDSMLPDAPFDPNLICPLCMRNFRVGEIQKYRKHVAECQGD